MPKTEPPPKPKSRDAVADLVLKYLPEGAGEPAPAGDALLEGLVRRQVVACHALMIREIVSPPAPASTLRRRSPLPSATPA